MRIRVDDSPFGPVTIHCKGPAGDFRVCKVRRLDTGEEVEPDSDEQVAEWEALARYAWDSKRGGRGRASGVWAAVLATLLGTGVGAGTGVARAETPEEPPEPSCTVSLHLVSQSVERGRGNTATLLARSRDCCHSPWIWAVYGGARRVRLDVKGSVWEEVQAAALKREGHNGEYTQVEARRCGQAARVVVYWQERPENPEDAGVK